MSIIFSSYFKMLDRHILVALIRGAWDCILTLGVFRDWADKKPIDTPIYKW